MSTFFQTDTPVEEIREKVTNYTGWYHEFEFPGEIKTSSQQKTPAILESLTKIGLPSYLVGKRVLDIGCCDGFYSFLMEKRGAEVVSIDYRDVSKLGFGIVKEIIGSNIEPKVDTVYNVTPEKYGMFDVVLFLGVLYHVRHPLLALDRLRSVLNEGGLLFLETHMTYDTVPNKKDMAMSRFYPRNSLFNNYTNYFGPNRACVDAWLDAAEFLPTGFDQPINGRGCFAARAVRDEISAKYRDLEWR